MSITLDGIRLQRIKFALSHELEHLVQEKNWIVLKVRAEELYSIFDNDTTRTPDELFGTDLDIAVPVGEYTINEDGALAASNGIWNARSVIKYIDDDLRNITYSSPLHAARETLINFNNIKNILIKTLYGCIEHDYYEVIGVIASVLFYYE